MKQTLTKPFHATSTAGRDGQNQLSGSSTLRPATDTSSSALYPSSTVLGDDVFTISAARSLTRPESLVLAPAVASPPPDLALARLRPEPAVAAALSAPMVRRPTL